ncbi:MAG: DUF2268 domain-containing putative Zn-dependent protease [Bacteroidota bacterium]|uniref:DUF2268 domain-containing protein n=1 Tax=Flagellimonas profundi TaxID=2915620 RepID=A0ABS3FEC3_9FLAO|nr:DUF2268 domain-containing putative Zn-dependent protease [Allomuricauda profundi]MBO0341065.1 hypothetical protein [Allomuricauda profundi]MEC7771755.1 DUF2268 domain-containing putative Zn-dependent protease [Bacteroidota bacterium]
MKSIKILSFLLALLVISNCKNTSNSTKTTSSIISFTEAGGKFTPSQKELIREVALESEKEIRALLPTLPDSIKVSLEIVDWDLDMVGGVTGRTETNVPPVVLIQISEKYPGGVTQATQTALKHTIFHEFHHLSRGWAIQDNKYGPGISIAAINEGLAVVFSEDYTGESMEADTPPEAAIAEQWVEEIRSLPLNANYQHWMFQHPDGRLAVGYRTGNYLIRKAMTKSGKDVLELSELTPDEIYQLAGY